MNNDVFLVLILLLIGGVTVLSVWASLRLGSYGGTYPTRAAPNARPPPKLGNADSDLIDKLRRVRYYRTKVR